MHRPLDVGPIECVAPGTALVVSYAVPTVALFNVSGRLYALEDACLHCGASLGSGRMVGMLVACVRCGWRYDVATGAVDGIPSLRVDTFDVRMTRGRVILRARSSRP